MSSGESLFIKIDSLEHSLNALFSQHKTEKSLKLPLLCSCNNRWSDIGLHATPFPAKREKARFPSKLSIAEVLRKIYGDRI